MTNSPIRLPRWLAVLAAASALACARDAAPEAPRVFRTGDAFTLRFEVGEATYPILIHVGPRGAVALVHPEAATAPLVQVAAGRRIELPDPASGAEWVFEGEPGWETFFLVRSPTSRVDLARVMTELEAPHEAVPRASVVSRVRSRLAALGHVEAVEVLHLP